MYIPRQGLFVLGVLGVWATGCVALTPLPDEALRSTKGSYNGYYCQNGTATRCTTAAENDCSTGAVAVIVCWFADVNGNPIGKAYGRVLPAPYGVGTLPACPCETAFGPVTGVTPPAGTDHWICTTENRYIRAAATTYSLWECEEYTGGTCSAADPEAWQICGRYGVWDTGNCTGKLDWAVRLSLKCAHP